jgi:hypothetical protein
MQQKRENDETKKRSAGCKQFVDADVFEVWIEVCRVGEAAYFKYYIKVRMVGYLNVEIFQLVQHDLMEAFNAVSKKNAFLPDSSCLLLLLHVVELMVFHKENNLFIDSLKFRKGCTNHKKI